MASLSALLSRGSNTQNALIMLYSRLDSMSYSLASVVLFSCALPAVLFVLSKRGKVGTLPSLNTVVHVVQLANIPTAGSGHFLGSLIDGFKFMTCADRIIQDGYEKVSCVV